ncbi:MAG: hypothetical protein JW913_04830 [Chitinispirillaceae bacterium]|nr:hypothetical protein [Chitinispirillaceae bacterium]
MQHFDHTKSVPGGIRQLSLKLPSCGGVSIDIESGSGIVKKTDLPVLQQTKELILRSRPAPDAVWWDCEGVEVKLLKGAMRDKRLNAPGQGVKKFLKPEA